MKYFLFVCQGLADEPVQDLDGRTPLEAAKTPVMNELAQQGRMRLASFVPANLEPTPEVAVLSILGYDPLEFYTGLAPLEAAAFGIEQNNREVIFRADLVSLLDDAMMDPSSGGIAEREASTLMKDLSAKFSNDKFQFYSGRGYKNYLVVRDPGLIEDLDDLECTPPSRCIGQSVSKHLPRGTNSDVVIHLMKEVSAFLENHEINRVRIDLGENPANRLWLWGQGKKPQLPSFEKRHGLSGAFHADADFVQGIAKLVGLRRLKEFSAVPEDDFIFFYFGGSNESKTSLDLKSKIKRIEDFDVFIGQSLKIGKKRPPFRVCVTGDMAESLTQKMNTRNPVPLLIEGEGIAAENNVGFNEKLCGQSPFLVDKGHEFLPVFLKS